MGIRTYGTSVDDAVIKESEEARKIVREIMNYGVSQNQILYIMNDLAMNLENQDHLRRLINVIRDIKDDTLIVTKKSPLEI
jgi:predicted transcriptional regulator